MVLKSAIPLPAKTAKVSRFPLFLISQGCGQFVIGSGQKFFGYIAESPEIIAPEKRLPFETFKDFKHDKESPV
jgi:hypothetical protein